MIKTVLYLLNVCLGYQAIGVSSLYRGLEKKAVSSMTIESDKDITPVVAVDTIENLAGEFPGFRRAHAKGIAFDATFVPNGELADYTTADHLQTVSVPAIVRFSHSSPRPELNEALMPIKGMAVRFELPGNKYTNLTMANIPVFITKTPEDFIRLLQMMSKESPLTVMERLEVFRKSPEFSTVPDLLKSLKSVSSFAEETFHALHTYYLVDSHCDKHPVRFRWIPVDAIDEQNDTSSKKDLESEILHRLQRGTVQFRLVVQFAEPGDELNDSSVKWPKERKLVEAGILTINEMRQDSAENIIFDPTAIVDGVECSDDPVLLFRSPAYLESAKRRQAERGL